jgi:hypothetical protein
VDTSLVPYLHTEKELARLRRLQDSKSKKALEQSTVTAPIAENRNAKEKSSVTGDNAVPDKRKRKKKEGAHKKIMDEWEELAAEEALFKKFKRGKITQEKYDDVLLTDDAVAPLLAKMEERENHSGDDSDDMMSDDDSGSDSDNDNNIKRSKSTVPGSQGHIKSSKPVATIASMMLKTKRKNGSSVVNIRRFNSDMSKHKESTSKKVDYRKRKDKRRH